MNDEHEYIKENDLDACPECDNPHRRRNDIQISRNLDEETSITCADCGLSWLPSAPQDPIVEKLNEARKSHTLVTVTLKNGIVLKGMINSLPDDETWYLTELNSLLDVGTATAEKSFKFTDVLKVD